MNRVSHRLSIVEAEEIVEILCIFEGFSRRLVFACRNLPLLKELSRLVTVLSNLLSLLSHKLQYCHLSALLSTAEDRAVTNYFPF